MINGEKWFSSNARYASLLVVMVVTDPDAPPYNRMSMFLVPKDTPGVKIIRNVAVGTGNEDGSHGYVRYTDVRVPKDHLLGQRGQGFVVAQTRLGRRPHPPRDAHDRQGAHRLRPDVRTGTVPGNAG